MRETGMHTLPSCLSKLSKMEKLDIGANDLTSLRELYQNANNLQELTVDQNRLRRLPAVCFSIGTNLSILFFAYQF